MIKVRRLTTPILPFFQTFNLPSITCGGQPCKLTDAERLIVGTLKFLWAFSGIVAVGVVLWGAYQLITSAGDPTKAESAKKTLFAGLIGAIIVITGYAFTVVFANRIFGNTVPIPPSITP